METTLFQEGTLGSLVLPNRIVRSATAERLALDNGEVGPGMERLYRSLAKGGVGLIITGHAYVHPSGKAHVEMLGIHDDAMVPGLTRLTQAVHDAGGKVAVQINHGGMQCPAEAVDDPIAPSDFAANYLPRAARAMTDEELEGIADAFGQAARRAREAGFDAVQIHAAHGYLISQFLSPAVNRRTDDYGGDFDRRLNFLRRVAGTVREQVGANFPVLIKLGVQDGLDDGLTPEDGIRVLAALESMGIDGVEISGGIGGGRNINTRPGIKREYQEAYFRPLARRAREVSKLPLILVGGLRSKRVMEDVLKSGDADFVSMCRPLICEPDLPERMRNEGQERASCLSGNNCWPMELAEGITCKCPVGEEIVERETATDPTAD